MNFVLLRLWECKRARKTQALGRDLRRCLVLACILAELLCGRSSIPQSCSSREASFRHVTSSDFGPK